MKVLRVPLNVSVRSRSNWNLEVLVLEERGKPEYQDKVLVLEERGKPEYQDKVSRSKGESPQQTHPHMETSPARI